MPGVQALPGTMPVVRSLLAPAALAETVGAAYRLDGTRCWLIKATIRDVYRVESRSGPAVLCVYRHGRRTVEEIGAELDVLDDLAERGPAVGVRVAPAVRTLAGEQIVTLMAPEGARHAVLFRFAEGQLLERAPEPTLARRYGQTIAQLHVLTDAWLRTAASARHRAPLDAALLVDRSLERIATFLGHRPSDLEALGRAAGLLGRRLAALPREAPGSGLVHGDVIPTNVLVAPDGRLTVLDFDFCGPGWRAFDVATYLHVARDDPATEASGRDFLAGYQEVRPLADWELTALPLFVAVRELFRLGNWGPRLEEWGTQALPDEAIERHLAWIREAMKRGVGW